MRKEEKPKISILSFSSKTLKKEEQIKYKV